MTLAVGVSMAGSVETGELGGDGDGGSEKLALQWISADTAAKLLVDETLRILWANPVALDWLRIGDCFKLMSGQLWMSHSQPQMQELIRRAEEADQGFCAPVEGAEAHVIICAKRLANAKGERCFGVTARRTDRPSDSPLFGVSEIFRVTPREMAVLRLLLAGRTAQEIANGQRISIETVRTHIRRIYTKLEVNSREGLFTRLRPFLIET